MACFTRRASCKTSRNGAVAVIAGRENSIGTGIVQIIIILVVAIAPENGYNAQHRVISKAFY